MKLKKKKLLLEIEEGNAIHKIEEYYENEIRLKLNSMFDKKNSIENKNLTN